MLGSTAKNQGIQLIIGCLLLICLSLQGQVIPVTVEENDGQWTYMREGKPYYVKGVGGHKYMDKAVEIGANSIRTWGVENAKEILDEAHSKGLTVMLGFWVQHERHGFDYDNPAAVKKQLEGFRKVVLQLREHPALLTWAVGNEVNLNYSNYAVWDAVQDIAAMCHELDPNHPTTTVTAGIAAKEVELINAKCPDIDVLSINTYGDIVRVNQNVRDYGWEGPYMITEWGPNGHWEVNKTEWGAAIEQTSSEKAVTYRERYQNFIAGDKGRCIGSYVFLWGQKQEKTSTWYGMFSADGKATEGIDELHKIWQGENPANAAPLLESLLIKGQEAGNSNIYLESETVLYAEVSSSDPDNDRLSYDWQITPESAVKSEGGDFETALTSVRGTIKKKKGNRLEFRVPRKEGPYRLFVFVYDGNEHYATANIPFFVEPRSPESGQSRAVQLKTKKLLVPSLETSKRGR